MSTKIERASRFYEGMTRLGFTWSEAQSLRRIEMTLHRWSERECNGEVERDEETSKTYQISPAYINGQGEYRRWPTPDKETGAIKRLQKIMEKHPFLWYYNQTDPRGCALYIGRRVDIGLPARVPTKEDFRVVEQRYTNGFAVCI